MFVGKKWASTLPRLKPVRVQPQRQKYPLSLFPKRNKRGRPPKPKPPKPWLKKMPDGREVLDTFQIEGWREYRRRVALMLERQEGTCCMSRICPFCPGALRLEEAEFEHQYGRGFAGFQRDDRILKPDENGNLQLLNGAAHHQCNRWKASRRLEYNDVPAVIAWGEARVNPVPPKSGS